MKKRKSIFQFLIVVMIFSLFLPMNAVNAEVDLMGKKPPKEESPGSLTIHKYAQEKGDKQKEGTGNAGQNAVGDPLDGVTFEIIQTHKFDPETDTWTPVNQWNAKKYTEVTVDGKIVINGIPLGRYSVQEVDGPDHVIINTKKYHVDIPMTSKDGSELNYNVNVYPKNETIRGKVKLTKTDGDKSKNAALQGVKFKLFHADGTEVNEGNVYETNGNGHISVDNLGFGDYYFQEIATRDGYVLGNPKVEFSIAKKDNGKTLNVNVKNYKEPDPKKEVSHEEINRGEIVTYTIKVDVPGDISSYKKFVVTDQLDSNLEYVDGSATTPTGFAFSADGQNLTWTATPSVLTGPSTIEFTFEAKVKEDAEVTYIENKAYVDYTNQYNHGGKKKTPPTKTKLIDGGFKVHKVDSKNHKGLKGAEFKLTDAEGNTIDASGTIITVNGTQHNGLLENLTTDGNGHIRIDRLPVGTYYLVETKAPTYTEDGVEKSYRLLTNPIEVEITKHDKSNNKTVQVKNSKSGWELPKTGGIGTTLFTFVGLVLMGAAVFTIIRRRNGDTV